MRPTGGGAVRLALAAALALASTGCISITGHFGTEIQVQNLEQIRDGETTREQIAAWFGPPSAFYNPTLLELVLGGSGETDLDDAARVNDVFTYRYIENESKVFFLPVLFAFVRAEALAETLTIFFDENGRVKYHAYRRDRTSPDD